MGWRKPTGKGWQRIRRRLVIGIVSAVGLFVLLSLLTVLALRWVDPPTTAFMLAYRLDQAATTRPRVAEQRWVSLERTSVAIRRAVIASEDQKFMQHFGFDFESMIDALADSDNGGRLRGASTITQQTAKNLFLWQGRSFVRKGLEAWFTLLIEISWSKRRILEVYLNVAEFGAGVYGVEAAARRFFGRPAAALTPYQAAALASVLPSPKRMNPRDPSVYMQERMAWIIEQMRYLVPGTGYPR